MFIVFAVVNDFAATWSTVVSWLSDMLVMPLLVVLHLDGLIDQPREIAQYFLLAMIQLAIIAGVLRPLESLWPAEAWTDRRATAIDRTYTVLKLLGALPLFTFLFLGPIERYLIGPDDGTPEPFNVLRWAPWLGPHPILLFVVYYAIYDFVYYCIHRLQHAIPWWWALHSLHHSQRQLSCWSNDRDHYLDDLLEALIVATVSLLIGASPTDYVLLILLGELLQNLDHANIRFRFGKIVDKLLIDPHYHRLHHMRVDPARPNLHNCNFAFVFPIWDILFGTALFTEPTRATGVLDPIIDADCRHGIYAQQVIVLKRFWATVRTRAGWRPGDVAFDENLRPVRIALPLSTLQPRRPDVSTAQVEPRRFAQRMQSTDQHAPQ